MFVFQNLIPITLVVLQELPYDNPYNQAKCYQTDVCECFHSLKQGYNHSENLLNEFPEKFE
jgi:hypothetical protein